MRQHVQQATGQFEIYDLDSSTQAWGAIGEAVDERENTRSDTLWDGKHLYLVSAAKSSTNTAHGARLLRYSCYPPTRDYSLDSGFSIMLTSTGMDEVTIEKDTAETLWITYTPEGDGVPEPQHERRSNMACAVCDARARRYEPPQRGRVGTRPLRRQDRRDVEQPER